MSRLVVLFAGLVCASLFVNVYGESILTADGKYKHDSGLAFTKVLKKLKDFTLPAGDDMLDKWIAATKAINKHLNAGDMKGLGQVSHGAISILRGILPSIPDKIVHEAIENLANKFEKEYDSSVSAGTAPLTVIDQIFQEATETMLSAMSKTKPTAETLN